MSAAQTDPSADLWHNHRECASYTVHLARCCLRLLRHVASAGPLADAGGFLQAAVGALHALDVVTVQMARTVLLFLAPRGPLLPVAPSPEHPHFARGFASAPRSCHCLR